MSSSPTETPTETEAGFDAHAFWILHKSKVLLLAALFVVALGAFGVSEWTRRKTMEESSHLLAGAKTDDDFRAVIAKYSKSMAAASAQLMLADSLRTAGNYDDSTAQLKTFMERFPTHPLASGALTSLGANQEAQGKTDEALTTYQKVISAHPTSFSAPIALLAQARLLKAQGKVDDAKRIYEQVIQQYQGTAFGQEAVSENQKLAKLTPPPTPATDAKPEASTPPVPAPAPTAEPAKPAAPAPASEAPKPAVPAPVPDTEAPKPTAPAPPPSKEAPAEAAKPSQPVEPAKP